MKKKNGFTIIEVLIVIAIIGVISGIVIPSVIRYFRNSQDRFNKSLITTLESSAKDYYSENKDELPRGQYDENNKPVYMDVIWASDLKSNNYLTGDFVDADDKVCDNKSYVQVDYDGKNGYTYKTCVICDDGYISDEATCNFEKNNGDTVAPSCNNASVSVKNTYLHNNINYVKNASSYNVEVSTTENDVKVIKIISPDIYINYGKSFTYKATKAIDTLSFIMYDANQNNSETCSRDLNVEEDSVKPTVTTDKEIIDNTHVKIKCIFEDTASGIAWYKIYKEGTTTNLIYEDLKNIYKDEKTITITVTENGNYICSAEDNVGNSSDDEVNKIVVDDIIKAPSKPTITASDATSTDKKLTGSWHTADSFDLNLNSTLDSSSAGSIVYKYSTNGGSSWNWISDSKIPIKNETKSTKYIVKACNSKNKYDDTLCSDETEYEVKLDKSNPTAELTNTTTGYGSSAVLNCAVSDTISGVKQYVIRKQNESDAFITLSTPVASKTPTLTVSENATYECIAKDDAGRTSTTATITVNNISYKPSKPTITANDNIASGSWHTANFTLKFSSTLDSKSSGSIVYKYSTDGGTNWTSLSLGTSSISINTETKTTTYTVKACNSNDTTNLCSANATYEVKLDKSNPTAVLTNTTTGYGSSAVLNCAVSDTISGVKQYVIRKQNESDAFIILSTPVASKTPTPTLTVSENATYECIAKDDAGRTSTTATITVNNISYKPINLSITANDNIASGSWHKANFKLNFSSTLDSKSSGSIVYKYSTDGGTNWTSLSAGTSSISISTETKTTTYTVKACNSNDTTNLCSSAETYEVKLDKTAPTAVLTNTTTTTGYVGSAVLQCQLYDATSGTIKYYIRKQGDIYPEYAYSYGYTGTIYPKETVYENDTYECLGVDEAGNVSEKSTVVVSNIVGTPGAPSITASDSKSSGSWHTANFNLNLSSTFSGTVVYKYSTDGGTNWTSLSAGTSSIPINTETKTTTYTVKACNGSATNVCNSTTASYEVKLDKTDPVCELVTTSSYPGTKASDSIYYYENYVNYKTSLKNKYYFLTGKIVDNTWYYNDKAVQFKVSCTDTISGINISKSSNYNYTSSVYSKGSNINNSISGYATDNAGRKISFTFYEKVTGRGIMAYDGCNVTNDSCTWKTNGSFFSTGLNEPMYRYCENNVENRNGSCTIGGGTLTYYNSHYGYSSKNTPHYKEDYVSGHPEYNSKASAIGFIDVGFNYKNSQDDTEWYFWLINEAGIVSYPIYIYTSW